MTVTVGVLALLLAGVWVVVAGRRGQNLSTWLRRGACALTLVVCLALTPWTFEDAGAAAGYLLGVPLVLSIIVVIADMSGRAVLAVTAVAGVVMLVWALLLALGIGLALLAPALMLLGSTALGLGAARRRDSHDVA